MKYLRNPGTGEVFAYAADGSQDAYIQPDLVLMTAEDVEAHLHPAPAPLTNEDVTALRRTAYADVITGSDPLYIEYQRELAMGSPAEIVEAAKAGWLKRAAEIAAQYPWPE